MTGGSPRYLSPGLLLNSMQSALAQLSPLTSDLIGHWISQTVISDLNQSGLAKKI